MAHFACIAALSACGTSLSWQAIPVQPGAGGTSAPVTGPGQSGAIGMVTSDEALLLEKINALRASRGLASLSLDSKLEAAARAHSAYMESMNTLTHSEPAPNVSSWTRVQNQGGNFNAVGENIACGNSDAEATYQQWYNSSGHLAIMLNASYSYIGLARGGDAASSQSQFCPWYWTADFGGY